MTRGSSLGGRGQRRPPHEAFTSTRSYQTTQLCLWLAAATLEVFARTGLDDLYRRYPKVPRDEVESLHAQAVEARL